MCINTSTAAYRLQHTNTAHILLLNLLANIVLLFWLIIALGIECLRKYLADEDVSKSSHKKFHSSNPDTIYPSITLCVLNPFLEHQLEQYGKGINITSYSYFLRGIHWDERMLKIDYDSVTTSLINNLILRNQKTLSL